MIFHKLPEVNISLLFVTITLSQVGYAQQNGSNQGPMNLLNPDESFHFEALLPLGESIYSGADIGPVLGAIKDIKPGDFESFSAAFARLAKQTKSQAEDLHLAYDPVNVRDTWFSTAQYFRRADFYLHGNWEDPRINEYWEEQISAFDKALASLPIPGQRLTIPTSDFNIEAIWYCASTDLNTKRPTMIIGNGYDGSQEDMYHTLVVPALARGWNAITYEGPGQPMVRRRQNKGFISDWERVVTPIVDYVLTNHTSSVDADRLVLFGYSFGGYLAARAAAFEPRLAAVLLNGGIWSTYDSFMSQLTPDIRKVLESGEKENFDNMIKDLLNQTNVPTDIRWGVEQGLWSFNTESPFDFLEMTKDYTIANVVDQIRVPTWVADAEFEGFFAGQAPLVKQALGDRATYIRFNGTAGYHCQVGALQEMGRTMFAWLNHTMA